jgi:hypothetical protein
MKIRFHRNPAKGYAWEIYAWRDHPGRTKEAFSIQVTATAVKDGLHFPEAVTIPEEDARVFIDALLEGLADAGLIPKMGATEAELKATKYHLEDFRKLVFEQAPKDFSPEDK